MTRTSKGISRKRGQKPKSKSSTAVGPWLRCFENARHLAGEAAEAGDLEFQELVWRLTRFVTLTKFLHLEFSKQRSIAPGRIGGSKGLATRNGISRHGVYTRIQNAGVTQDMLEEERTTLDDLVRNNPVLRDIAAMIDQHRTTLTASKSKLPHRWPLATKKQEV